MNITFYKQKKKNARRAMEYYQRRGWLTFTTERRIEKTIRNCNSKIKLLKQQREKKK